MTEPIVKIEHLDVTFDTVDGAEAVLKDVNLEIGPGEIVGLVGETGCGKSATAKLLLGILPMPPARVRSGSVSMFGEDIFAISREARQLQKRHIAYVPQDPMASLNPSFTIGEQMIDLIVWDECGRSLLRYFIARRRGAPQRLAREKAIHLLEKVYISDPADVLRRYPTQLSGGMRQRVLLAMALSGAPRLMIADEPTTALDVTVQKRTIELIKDLVRRENLAGLYITHDLGVAREICARSYVMYGGTTVESAPTAVLLDGPLHPYSSGLIGSMPSLRGGMPRGIDGHIPDYLTPPAGCRFAPRCDRRHDACRQKPPLASQGEQRSVACWLYPSEGLAESHT